MPNLISMEQTPSTCDDEMLFYFILFCCMWWWDVMDVMIQQEYIVLENSKPKICQRKTRRRYKLVALSFYVWPILKIILLWRRRRLSSYEKNWRISKWSRVWRTDFILRKNSFVSSIEGFFYFYFYLFFIFYIWAYIW